MADFSDLGGQPLNLEEDKNKPKVDFSDLGGVAVQAEGSNLTPLPPSAEGQQLTQIADKELSSFQQGRDEFAKQFINKITVVPRVMNQLRTQQATSLLPPDARQIAQGEEGKMQDAVPLLLKEKEAKGAAGTAGAFLGMALEPVTMLSAGIGGKVAEVGVEKLLAQKAEKVAADAALFQARNQINRQAADQAVAILSKQNLLRGAVEGAGSGAAAGLVSGALDNQDQGRSGNDALMHLMKTTAGGTGIGLLGGSAATYLGPNRQLRKTAGEIPGSKTVVQTPATAEISAQLDQLVLERAQMSAELEATQKLSAPTEATRLQQQLKLSHLETPYELADSAAQRAASVEEVTQARAQAITDARAQQVARLDAEILGHQAQLETLKIDPRPLEERFPAQQKLEKAIESKQKAMHEISTRAEQEATSLQAKAQEHLDEISGTLDSRLTSLTDERNSLLKRLQGKMAAPEKIVELQERLRANLEQQAKLTQTQRQFGFKGADAPRSEFAINQGVEIAQQQYDKAYAHLSDAGSFTPEQIQAVAEAEFKNAIHLQGIKTDLYSPTNFGSLSNDIERMSKMGSITGTNVGEVALKTVYAQNELPNVVEPAVASWNQVTADLRSRGWTNEQITKSLQYMESAGFNPQPKATRSMTREQWPLDVPPSAQDLQSLQMLRAQLNAEHANAVSSGLLKADQHVEGYVPLLRKPGAPADGRAVKGLIDPAFAKERVSGKLDPIVHEMDADQLFLRYKKQVAASQIYAPILRDGAREIIKLRLMGQEPAAQVFEKYLRESYNLKSDVPIETLFGHSMVNAQVDRMLEAGLPQAALDEVYNAASSTMYKNVVATSPKNMILQYVQPEFLLPAEVGAKEYAKARAMAFSPKTRKSVEPLLKYVIKGDLPATEELLSRDPKNLFAKALKKSGDLTDTLQLTKPFQLGEKQNRYTALIAGKQKFMSAFERDGFAGVQRATSGFLPSEQAFIEKAFKQGGAEAGSDAMALIVDRRANFSYARGDKTEALRTGLGKFIPFTTFYRNIIARYQGDIQNGNYTQLAKRLAASATAATFFQSLTGKDFGDSTVKDQLKRAMSEQSFAPALTSPVRSLFETKDLGKTIQKEALKLTPAQPLIKMQENMKRTGNPFGLRPVARDSWTRKLLR
jgi:hypothetical protein